MEGTLSYQLMLFHPLLLAQKKKIHISTANLKMLLNPRFEVRLEGAVMISWFPSSCTGNLVCFSLQKQPQFLAIRSCSTTPPACYLFLPQCSSAKVAGENGVDAAPPWSPNSAGPGHGFAARCPAPPQLHHKAGATSAKVVTGGNML